VSDPDTDPTRRTLLAAERTWLAWWRTGIAAATAAVAVGGVVPQLVDGSRTPFIALGGGFAALAVAVFAGAGVRQVRVERALGRGEYDPLPISWVVGLTLAGAALALAALVVVVLEG
jgi:putative membrane protein